MKDAKSIKKVKKKRMKKKIIMTIEGLALLELDSLRNSLGLKSIKEVIGSSLTLVKYLQIEKKNGNEVILRNKLTGKEREIIFLGKR